MRFPRILEGALERAWRSFPVVVMTGARQVGKTTLARHFLPKADYRSLDLPSEADRARLTPEEFLAGAGRPVVIDEVQYAPELFRHLKHLVDSDRQPGSYLLTGSQNFELMRSVSDSLAGRCMVLTLPALGAGELPDALEPGFIGRFLWRGGYPELWKQPKIERDWWLSSYIATYLERDVRNLLNVGSLRDFDRFLRAAALRAGRMLSYAELARDLGISPHTAKSWISVLEASQQVFLLEPYHRQRTKRLVKSPKLYFTDTGLLTFLMGFRSPDDLRGHALWGAIWENLVVTEIRKSFLNAGTRPPMWFWRTSDGYEIDLLVETAPERFIVIECKAATVADRRDLRGLGPLRSEYGEECVERAIVACRAERPCPLAEGGRLEAAPLLGKGGVLSRIEKV